MPPSPGCTVRRGWRKHTCAIGTEEKIKAGRGRCLDSKLLIIHFSHTVQPQAHRETTGAWQSEHNVDSWNTAFQRRQHVYFYTHKNSPREPSISDRTFCLNILLASDFLWVTSDLRWPHNGVWQCNKRTGLWIREILFPPPWPFISPEVWGEDSLFGTLFPLAYEFAYSVYMDECVWRCVCLCALAALAGIKITTVGEVKTGVTLRLRKIFRLLMEFKTMSSQE